VEDWDRIQLCAQALCIEEMRETQITEAAIWYWEVRKREQTICVSEVAVPHNIDASIKPIMLPSMKRRRPIKPVSMPVNGSKIAVATI